MECSTENRVYIPKVGKAYYVAKRTFDVLVSSLGLVVLSPVLLIVIIAIVLESPGSPIFLQPRIGKNCKPFKMVKLRSMRKDAEKILETLSEEQYRYIVGLV